MLQTASKLYLWTMETLTLPRLRQYENWILVLRACRHNLSNVKLSGVMEEGQPEDALARFAGKVSNTPLDMEAVKVKAGVYEAILFDLQGSSINAMFQVIEPVPVSQAPDPGSGDRSGQSA